MQCRHCGQPPFKNHFYTQLYTYLCPCSQVPASNHRNCCLSIWCHVILCPEYWLKPTFTWSWGRWRKQLTGMTRHLLLMALIGRARVGFRNAWAIMITACSYLACSPIFTARTNSLHSSQCKPGWQVYTHTHTRTHYKPALAHQTTTPGSTCIPAIVGQFQQLNNNSTTLTNLHAAPLVRKHTGPPV